MREPVDALVHDLELLGRAVSYPATPPLAARVGVRLSAPAARSPAWGLAGVGIAAVIVFLAAIAGIVSPAREAMADLFGQINIFEVDEVPGDLSTDVQGEQATLAEAEDALGRPIRLPEGSDGERRTPAKVLLQRFPESGVSSVALFLESDDGVPYILFQTNTQAAKGLGQGATARRVSGLGSEAYWLQGVRIVQLSDPSGELIQESERRAESNTLIWAEDGFVYRIEGDLTDTEAVEVARALR
jgi:hypothetical protein